MNPYTMGVNSKFYENLRRYSKVKVLSLVSTILAINKKIFEIGNFFHILLRCCLVAVYTPIMFLFYLMFTLRCNQAVFVVSVSLQVSLTLSINYRRYCCYR
jgi:hypothetical protein